MRSTNQVTARRRVAFGGVVLLLASMLALAPLVASAAHPAQVAFALDGYVLDQTPTDPPYDWDDAFSLPSGGDPWDLPVEDTLPASGISSDFTRDFLTDDASSPAYVNGDQTYFATGSKDVLDIPGWQCKKANNATDKGDWVNAYGIAANVAVAGGTNPGNHIVFYFGLEKDDDNGTNNIGVWLLQDETIACFSEGGKAKDFTGAHKDGDLLAVVEYDSGGNVGTARGYLWEDPDGPGGVAGFLNETPAFEETAARCDGGQDDDSEFCIVTNADGGRTTPWWSPQKGNRAYDADLQTNVFVEGFLDITNVFGPGNEPCFAGALANTRASTSLTAALYDYVGIQAPTCGPLVIEKYLDVNANGSFDAGTDVAGAGWEFKVYADGADPATATPLYTGTTDATGKVEFLDVPFGAYDVYETLLSADWYNTDPGTAAPIKKDVTKSTGTDTVKFGNACFVDKTFQVLNVPAGTSNGDLKVSYQVSTNGGVSYGSAVDVALNVSGSTASATVANTFVQADWIRWSFSYASGTPSGSVVGSTGESLASYGYPTCATTNTVQFPYATVSGTKYKDADADGDFNDTDAGLAGFDFKLWQGSSGGGGTQVGATQTSDTNGDYSFSTVAPGSYSVTEVVTNGWKKTYPTAANNAGEGFHTVTVNLGDSSVTVEDFLNTPLTDLYVEVDPQTNFTYVESIQCVDGSDATIGVDVSGTQADAGATKSSDIDNLVVGTYTCTVVIVDP